VAEVLADAVLVEVSTPSMVILPRGIPGDWYAHLACSLSNISLDADTSGPADKVMTMGPPPPAALSFAEEAAAAEGGSSAVYPVRLRPV
jgi:hypothetical protein